MRNIANLHRISQMFSARLDADAALPEPDRPYMPLLWMDASALDAMLAQSVIALELARVPQLPQAWLDVAQASLRAHARHCKWLKISIHQQDCFMPVVLLEDMQSTLDDLWADLRNLHSHYSAMCSHPGGAELLRAVGFCDDVNGVTDALAKANGPDVAAFLRQLADHARMHWGKHGLLCLAADLLRLQVVQLLPGAYIDIGDVAGRLACLPTRRLVCADQSEFCGHQTVAIENDLFFCQRPSLMKAIAFGTYLWSVNTFRGMVQRLAGHASHAALPPCELLRTMLPHIDARMPSPPDIGTLFAPPLTHLANYICMAYQAQPMFDGASKLSEFFRGKQGREHLINHVGGFTGYQKFAFHLAPRTREVWERCEAQLGMQDYAPQLGWKAYGFGTIDKLIADARLLTGAHTLQRYAQAEINQLATTFGHDPERFRRIAIFCVEVFDRALAAHLQADTRDRCKAAVLESSLRVF